MSDGLSITLPKEQLTNKILFKIEKEKVISPVLKYRSFRLYANSFAKLMVAGKEILREDLFDLLKKHGLSPTIPITVTLGPTKFLAFDWHPVGYRGPTVWPFKWGDIECSFTGDSECYNIRVHDLTPGVGEKVLDELSVELLKYWKNPIPDRSISIYSTTSSGGIQWYQYGTRIHRDLATIYIDPEAKDKLITQLNHFYASKSLYDRYGVTWKRVHLFYGPPGSGKTSTVLALASKYKQNIAKLTVTPSLNSQHLETLFKTVPENTFLLIEDVDALFTGRVSDTSIDFSTLLNCMDGLATRQGLVVFMTTNHLEKLDGALVRPGRVDLCLEFTHPGMDELRAALKVLAEDYVHEHEKFLDFHGDKLTIAALQRHLFECIIEKRDSIMY